MQKTILLLLTLCLSVSPSISQNMKNHKPFTVLVLMNATPQWLSLTRQQRTEFFETSVAPAFQAVGKTVVVRLFDSEYFHAQVSDFMIITAESLDDYQELIERLRDTKIYGVPYFEIRDVIVGQENRFEDFNEQFKKDGK